MFPVPKSPQNPEMKKDVPIDDADQKGALLGGIGGFGTAMTVETAGCFLGCLPTPQAPVWWLVYSMATLASTFAGCYGGKKVGECIQKKEEEKLEKKPLLKK